MPPSTDLPLRLSWIQQGVVFGPDTPIEPLVDAVLGNPWHRFEMMDFDTALEWRSVDRDEILRGLRAETRPIRSVRLRTDTGWASIQPGPDANIVLHVVASSLAREVGLEAARLEAKRIAVLLAELGGASYGAGRLQDADSRPWRVLRDRGLQRLPKPLQGYFYWSAWCSPAAYEPATTKEALLGAPAHAVEEWPHGIVYLEAIEDPFDFFSDESLAKVERLNRYLHGAVRS